MWNIQLLQQIFSEKWFIDQRYEQQMGPLILHAVLEGKPPEGINEGLNVQLSAQDDGAESYGWKLSVIENGKTRKVNSFSEARPNSIALLYVDGPVMRSDGLCAMGTETMSKIVKGADSSPNISAIILETNSPGGQVTGTEQFAAVIRATDTPIYTYAHFAASAAYWISAASDEIWSSGRSNEFGSIGTMAKFHDYSGYLEKMGIKEIEVYASESQDKNRPFREAKAGNVKPMQEEILDPTNEIFRSEMRQLRNLPEDTLHGKLYLAESALEKGLIDRIGTREQLVAHIMGQHIKPSNSYSINTNAMAEESENNQSWLTQLSGLFPNKEKLQGLTNELQQTSLERDDYKAKYEALQAQQGRVKTDLEAKLQTAIQERDDWKSKAEAYGSQAGERPSIAQKEGGDEPLLEQTPDWFDANASHNQFVQEFEARH